MKRVTAERLPGNPMITRFQTPGVGVNVNGPSLIRTPEWLPGRLGRYHMYFAHHLGGHIRLAYADDLKGPWAIHEPGVLALEDVPQLHDHLASPDVHVDEAERRLRMYFHGVSRPLIYDEPPQETCVALSEDGLQFHVEPGLLGASYFRVWSMGDWFYALSLDGWLWRSKDSTVPFEPGPRLGGLPDHVRHMAVLSQEDRPCLAWSVIGDCPERIFLGRLNADGDWSRWSVEEVQEVLRPECDWEGADQPLSASQVGMVTTRVNQLRDPAFYREDGVTYLAYSIAGEAGLALARLNWEF